ncbi:phosphoribosyl-ATP pyrophosphohydrolase/phosphoribosyl-AMP cyclohydrolase [Chryseobacterium ginsenosidimutans]|uniref:bifunctional phosphoribosyl-AMP cyclohydrolase/phosphoribosyl-ATP diphosphatase HisIE n=1 Tax=Chryseobacterium ginsenosidimutans TaxID=687846 RepID=UPI0027809EDA|nr:bifunctional phosphoribosyl-AMP cyclohydrolase/phosphoribosyl-ATP diphosphatase HisIE [Chryseobacterium ginsenosidimutans]MDQ0594249.1 phosphoribosyl-ATP pyrophosphohydrolase/phosphoribosyl-AMP cyclohydrolase [Chryseobacterium ginsenosidimutans]
MNMNFNKSDGLIPVIIQDNRTLQVLMLGYMNEEAFEKTKIEGIVTFFSRSKNRLWTKGEESGNFLMVKSINVDCDQDTILIKAVPENIVCHTGSFSCFGEKDSKGFLYELEGKINQRIDEKIEDSYTYSLYQKGMNKVAQKVGEEAIELVIEAKDNDDVLFKNEAADLLYHYLILLKAKNIRLEGIEEILVSRDK